MNVWRLFHLQGTISIVNSHLRRYKRYVETEMLIIYEEEQALGEHKKRRSVFRGY